MPSPVVLHSEICPSSILLEQPWTFSSQLILAACPSFFSCTHDGLTLFCFYCSAGPPWVPFVFPRSPSLSPPCVLVFFLFVGTPSPSLDRVFVFFFFSCGSTLICVSSTEVPRLQKPYLPGVPPGCFLSFSLFYRRFFFGFFFRRTVFVFSCPHPCCFFPPTVN